MILLILGVALWWGAHLIKRLAPSTRTAMTERLGEGSKGIIAISLVVSIVLMVIGYRAAAFVPVYDPPDWTRHLNNLAMVIAFVLLGVGHSKSRLKAWVRHPMLLGFGLWALAHLAVNGDLASIILFGGLLVWVPVTMALINRAEPAWDAPVGGSMAGDLRLVGIGVALTLVVGLLHGWIGPWPFPG